MSSDVGTVVACVGATGGVGTTRTAVELARLAQLHDQQPLVVDTAVATQGLARLLIETPPLDLCGALAAPDTLDLEAIAVELPTGLTIVPIDAPLCAVAPALSAEAATALDRAIARAAAARPLVIVDVPPVATNLAVAGIARADVILLMHRAGDREAVRRGRELIADLAGPDPHPVTVGTPALGELSLPELSALRAGAPLATPVEDPAYRRALAEVAATAGVSIPAPTETGGWLQRLLS
ncbi:MAG: cellulose synthase operon protein YhjQ/BcsQ [Haloquadratum sp.]|nr:cellulose synthase operon protein YhjQ/BcsQ [Haloquadratum sp.]